MFAEKVTVERILPVGSRQFSAAERSLPASLFQVFDYVRNRGLIFHAFQIAVMQHSVVVEYVTADHLRDSVSTSREESYTNNLSHGSDCRFGKALGE